ncbi:hypothetical protein BKK79_03405 [Cupriavidus sp. USMAA2-4]|nr:hypothetical protein BKK79_03405 [Cupriavidus sp. USMAA2-4]
MEIRSATPHDAERISSLIRSVSRFFTLDPHGLGAEGFLARIEPEAVRGYISAPDFRYAAGFIDGELAGVVAMRGTTHLYHLFVAPAFQGRGLSRLLWEHAKADAMVAGNREAFTVNSTPYAVPVYERFGFRVTGARVERDGIAFVPMALRPGGGQPA